MKPFEMPEIKLEKFSVEDVMTVSYGNETPLLPLHRGLDEAIRPY